MGIFKSAVALISTIWLLAANTSLEAPRIGFVRTPNAEVWTLRGVAGGFYYGQQAGPTADGLAFNGRFGLRITGQRADLLGANGEVLRAARVEGRILQFGLSPIEDSAFVLTESELWRLTPASADLFPAPDLPEGRLVGLSGAGPYVDLAMVQEGQVAVRRIWFESNRAIIREAFAANPSQLLFLDNGMLLWAESQDGALVIRRPDASTAQIDTGSPMTALHEVGQGWFHSSGEDGRQFILQITGDPKIPSTVDMKLRLLPGTAR